MHSLLAHVADYNLSGNIWLKKQAEHICNTGAEQKQTIVGTGNLEKEMSISMIKGRITVDDDNDFPTAENALQNFVITSVIKLCSPPKHTYEFNTVNAAVAINAYYRESDRPRVWSLQEDGSVGWSGENWFGYSDGWQPVSKQIWAARVEANPGYSGRVDQDHETAYGPYTGGTLTENDDRWRLSSDGESDRPGPLFVGDFFRIRQTASTKMGVVMRHIDISSPWSHAYLYENAEIIGIATVRESFRMSNISVGSDFEKEWYKLF